MLSPLSAFWTTLVVMLLEFLLVLLQQGTTVRSQ
jgi:hypothetical protein